ncbi:MAG: hypothetical protein HY332_05560 [Chloroflexi bacterium]|nr:hypothetical protein [Chloroflexota bacterium]
MSTTDRPTSTTAAAPTAASRPSRHVAGEQAEPQPWRSAEDAKGWKVIARGRRRPGGAPVPLIRLTMHLDAAQSEWLRQEAERTGLGYDELMLKLLDDARAQRAVPPPDHATMR